MAILYMYARTEALVRSFDNLDTPNRVSIAVTSAAQLQRVAMEAIDFESMLKQARAEAFTPKQPSEAAPALPESAPTALAPAGSPNLHLGPRDKLELQNHSYAPDALQGVRCSTTYRAHWLHRGLPSREFLGA